MYIIVIIEIMIMDIITIQSLIKDKVLDVLNKQIGMHSLMVI